jgi:N-acetyl-anhydromuramyl-L-alanine amidase AmpD
MLVVILHQTTTEAASFLEAIPTASYSYHAFINKLGDITYLVPSSRQALACANCQIKGIDSVDKYAYQICLESTDGSLTDQQYMSIGYLLSNLDVKLNDTYTHSDISPSTDLELIDRDKLIKAFNKFIPNKTIYTGLE